jgi:hypothetical protein
VLLLVAHRRLMVVLQENQVSARWKHYGSTRPKNAAQSRQIMRNGGFPC